MLFRCRWCERSFCEDCLDWEKTEILGENLKEYELVGFPAIDQAWYIKCPKCEEDHEENPSDRAKCDEVTKEIDEKYNKFMEERASAAEAEEETKKVVPVPSRDESLTDATTVETPGVATPALNSTESELASNGQKRKASYKLFGTPSQSSSQVGSTVPISRKRKAAPVSFSKSFEIATPGQDESDWSTASTGRKPKAASKSFAVSPSKRSKRLTA